MNYEFDLAGRVQRSVEGVRASAEQAAADFENTRLLLGTDLATAYFNLRAIDIELDVLARSLALQRRSLDFVSDAPRPRRRLGPRRRPAAGAARHDADPARRAAPPARAVRARGRDADRNAGAVVLARRRHPRADAAGGAARRSFRRARAPARRRLRGAGDGGRQRPDRRRHGGLLPEHHDRAERSASRAARWRTCSTRRACSGRSARRSRSRCSRPAGIDANVEFARANYDATVASYRRVVLTAMQEVEDGITSLSALESADRQARTRGRDARASSSSWRPRATRAARRPTSTSSPRSSRCSPPSGWRRSCRGQRLLTSVFLIKALGGDWDRPAPLVGG